MSRTLVIEKERLPGEKLRTNKENIVELNDNGDCLLRIHEAEQKIDEKEHIR